MTEYMDSYFHLGWFNSETGEWDKEQPDLPAFMIKVKEDE